jgi:hypothetical protein
MTVPTDLIDRIHDLRDMAEAVLYAACGLALSAETNIQPKMLALGSQGREGARS